VEIDDILNKIANLNYIDTALGNSLISKLNGASASIDKGNTKAAINQLQALINQIQAQSGKKLFLNDADDLIALTLGFIEAL